MLEEDYLDFIGFTSPNLEALSAASISTAIGFLSYRLIEAIFAAVTGIVSFVLVGLIVLSVLFSPSLVLGGVFQVVQFVFALFELGDNQ